MQPVDYDEIASAYDRRYAVNSFDGIERCLRAFIGQARTVAELGCGTGHWVRFASELPHRPSAVGLDRSSAMLAECHRLGPTTPLVQATADRLPWRTAFDRVFCVNALHHFPNHSLVFRECSRVLHAEGAFLTIGLDPHRGVDQWWIYVYFPEALTADRSRYPGADVIRRGLTSAGFQRTETIVAQHIPARIPFAEAMAKGILDRQSTSQLLVIGDTAWEAGIAKLRRDRPELRADLRLYATIGWRS
ncbi:MAG TPA: class I SAM-dependent methyltransferase [Gemmatimonadaceae bacterium]|nr:class I SAM-dependent methyltransferase [Gemmatimonadaceae bacterium]